MDELEDRSDLAFPSIILLVFVDLGPVSAGEFDAGSDERWERVPDPVTAVVEMLPGGLKKLRMRYGSVKGVR